MSTLNINVGLAVALALGFLGTGAASATPIKFNINGTFDAVETTNLNSGETSSAPTTEPFIGTIDVDTTAGTINSADITLPGYANFPAFNVIFASGSGFNPRPLWALLTSETPPPAGLNAFPILDFEFTTTIPQSLVGFTSGDIFEGTGTWTDSDNNMIELFGATGSITPASVAVPEPAALGTFGLGLLLIGGFIGLRGRDGRRFNKEALS